MTAVRKPASLSATAEAATAAPQLTFTKLFAGPNVANVSNTEAGIGNTALQGATVLQHSGGWFGQPNFANVQNLAVAAGIGNFAGRSASSASADLQAAVSSI